MAYQKQTYQDGTTEYTAELFEHIDDGVFGAYPVQLIAISDTTPSECVEGDKYYNTSTKKIYTATGTNTWGTNGETPLEDTAYWLISENGNYAWDGTDLVSIGGGKAEVVISDEEPEEGKLWVDTAEIPVIAGREHLVQVSNEVDEDYRVNFLHSKNLFNPNEIESGTRLGTNGTTIPDQYATDLFTSLYIEVEPSTQYTINISGGTYSSRLCLYTSAKAFISYDDNGGTFTTPSNAKYIRFTNTIANIENVMLFKGDSVPTTYEPYITPSIFVDDEEIYSKPVVLWANPSPTSTFTPQEITLSDNLSNYSYYEVLWLFATSTPNIQLSTGKIEVGKQPFLGTISTVSGALAGYRRLTDSISDTSITFGNGTRITTSGTTDNTICIPYKILGYDKKFTSTSQNRALSQNYNDGEIVSGQEE